MQHTYSVVPQLMAAPTAFMTGRGDGQNELTIMNPNYLKASSPRLWTGSNPLPVFIADYDEAGLDGKFQGNETNSIPISYLQNSILRPTSQHPPPMGDVTTKQEYFKPQSSESNSGYTALTPNSILGQDTPSTQNSSFNDSSPAISDDMSFHSWPILNETNIHSQQLSSYSESLDIFDEHSNSKNFKVTFLACRKNKKTDFSKFTKSAQIVRQLDGSPVVYVERGKEIYVLIKYCHSQITKGFTLRISTYALTSGAKSPVFGVNGLASDGNNNNNVSFVQMLPRDDCSVEDPIDVLYSTDKTGFTELTTTINRVESIINLKFPYLSSKCPTTSRRDVRLNFSILGQSGETLTNSEFQLVSCVSPARDAFRHESKLSPLRDPYTVNDPEADQPKKRKRPIMDRNNESNKPLMSRVNGKMQYVIMTEDIEIWKVLNNLKKQLTPLFGKRRIMQTPRNADVGHSLGGFGDLSEEDEHDETSSGCLDEFLNY